MKLQYKISNQLMLIKGRFSINNNSHCNIKRPFLSYDRMAHRFYSNKHFKHQCKLYAHAMVKGSIIGSCIFEYNEEAEQQIIDDILSDPKIEEELNKWKKRADNETDYWKKVLIYDYIEYIHIALHVTYHILYPDESTLEPAKSKNSRK